MWRAVDDEQRAALRAAAQQSLLKRRDTARSKRSWSNWARAACYGIALLRHEIATDSELRMAVQTNWPRVVFDNPFDEGSAVQRAAIAAIYNLVPEIAAKRLAVAA